MAPFGFKKRGYTPNASQPFPAPLSTPPPPEGSSSTIGTPAMRGASIPRGTPTRGALAAFTSPLFSDDK
ncbi:hypothetical protein QTN25_003496 [Entamoeba marina]